MAGIIHVSEAASIAFHTVFHLATGGDELVQKRTLSKELGVSEQHLAKIIQRLAHADILQTVRGPKGGCRLTAHALDLSLLDVYEAVEGPYQLLGCLLKRKLCPDKCCLLGGVLQKMSRDVYEQLKRTTLKDVASAIRGATG